MEYQEIKALLEKYFEGNTSLKEEANLRHYFSSNEDIPEDMAMYKVLFGYYENAQNDAFPKRKRIFAFTPKILAIAASVAFLIVLIPFQSGSSETNANEEAALAAFEQFKGSITQVSKNLNQGIESVHYVGYWNDSTQKLLK